MESPTQMSRLFNKYSALAIAALLAVFVTVLHLMGRTPFGKVGFGIWTWAPSSPATSQLLGDPYSFSHVLHGIIFFFILWLVARKLPVAWRLVIATVIEAAWEIFENTPFIIDRYRAATSSLDYYGDSIWNSFGDVLFCILGFYIAFRLPWKWTLALVIAIELVMLLTIRDNLTLNVIMLLYPIQAIKQWQLGA